MYRLLLVFGVLICAGCRRDLGELFEEWAREDMENCRDRPWTWETKRWYPDADGDGFGYEHLAVVTHCDLSETHVTFAGDCDDSPETGANIFPRAPEMCDGVDNNCVDGVDEPNGNDGTFVVYFDADLDGVGDGAETLRSCDGLPARILDDSRSYVPVSGDCEDGNALVRPGMPERCNGYDDDCDGVTDLEAVDSSSYFEDADLDGYGSETVVHACEQGVLATNADDCDDLDSEVYPGALEVCNELDDDCDGQIDALDDDTPGLDHYYPDRDGDGYGDENAEAVVGCTAVADHVGNAEDCDDETFGVNPDQFDYCDEVDDNCSGDESDAIGRTTFYHDSDRDGFGDDDVSVHVCFAPVGYTAVAGDCNDARNDVHPNAPETCNGTDSNCRDGELDAVDREVWYEDRDGDHFGNAEVTVLSCSAVVGYWFVAGDCDDNDPEISPDAQETCNGYDDDCDALVDDLDTAPTGRTTFYRDRDDDGYGTLATRSACVEPDGYAEATGDCDDDRSSVNPGATEVCNGRDDDCDAGVDEGVTIAYYTDTDRDTYGVGTPSEGCAVPDGYASRAGDCDDSRASVNPRAPEICDEIDNDCDSLVDEGAQPVDWYRDADSDTWGDPLVVIHRCAVTEGYVTRSGDCNDQVAAIRPGADEVCDLVDNDCDGQVDDADSLVVGAPAWYADLDLDGAGGETNVSRCEAPETGSWTSEPDDCDDDSAEIFPGAVEICNDSVDNDCDAEVDGEDSSAGCLVVWCRLVDDPVFPMRIYAKGPVRRWLDPELLHPFTGEPLPINQLRALGGTVNTVDWLGDNVVHEIARHPANGRFMFIVTSEEYAEGQARSADVLRDGIALDPVQNTACMLDLSVPQTDQRYMLVP